MARKPGMAKYKSAKPGAIIWKPLTQVAAEKQQAQPQPTSEKEKPCNP